MIAQKLDLKTVKDVYEKRLILDFPKDEVKPLATIINGFNNGIYDAYGYFEAGKLLAYAFFVIDKNCRLLDYLAVSPKVRGSGVGSRFLQALKTELKDSCELVIIESENPDAAQNEQQKSLRERRVAFYLKNGAVTTGSTAKIFGVDYKILALPLSENATFTTQKYLSIYKNLLTKRLFEENIKVFG